MDKQYIEALIEKYAKTPIQEKLKKEEIEELPTTSTTSTTSFVIDSWGCVDLENKILLEQISETDYLYNIQGAIGLKPLIYVCKRCGGMIHNCNKDKVKCSCGASLNWKEDLKLLINDFEFRFRNKPNTPLYNLPDLKQIELFLCNSTRNRIRTKDLFKEIVDTLNVLFDFHRPEDPKICALFIMFSYVVSHFNSVFYLGVDATKGSGKTTLLEIISLLMRHGFLADCSPASIPRLKQKYDLSLAVDEIDQLRSFEDLQGLLRKGQRRGNKYVRLNKNSLEEEIYEAFGLYLFSFRSVLEDAFKQRSVLIRTARAKDSRLSILNLEKSTILKPLFNKIFLWYVENLFTFGSRSSQVVEVVGGFTPSDSPNDMRKAIYDEMIGGFSQKEQKILDFLFGRNSEIGYLFFKVSKFLDIDITSDIQKTLEEKQQEEETPDDYYFDLIKEIFNNQVSQTQPLSKGDFAGYRYYPKSKFYIALVNKLKNSNLMGIGSPKFNSLLKDIGFIEGYNIKNQKWDKVPVKCLIFDKSVLNKLDIDYAPEFDMSELGKHE